ncbi:hypothetical protein H2198_006392 [Neophaeococcomyces mojaviensis]|uniref:Uncharacterized protein n=1 Tax=Neophaeococcomyces mojaviensis TaxID=3383035 RepID=A0ACC3A2Y3_9EURO|nr:hypothetical protein H2198_006392 [Knufia sp. JES_112]
MREEATLNDQIRRTQMNDLERSTLTAIQNLRQQNKRQIEDLRQSLSPRWLGAQSTAAKMLAAKTWLSENFSLVTGFSSEDSSAVGVETDAQLRAAILKSLSFAEMNDRYNAIPNAQRRTFGWMFEGGSDSLKSEQNFADWLKSTDQASRGVYWVSGKPGSGKSTLLRFLSDDPRTLELARGRSGLQQALVARCFFWNSGTMLQKSQQGLLQTLLYQLLSKRPDFPSHLFLDRWQLLKLNTDCDLPWSLDELRDAIFACARHFTQETNIVMFIDGLDEYQGNDEQRQEVCSLLHSLSQIEGVKVCTSSRPWNIYLGAFENDFSIRLEQLTRSDIHNFVEEAFSANEYFRRWSQLEHTAATKLIETVVDRARGVFLWVRLVVHSLLAGLRDGDDTYEMKSRLEEIPEDLEDYFRQMMLRIRPSHRYQASQILQLALFERSALIVYHFVHEVSNEANPQRPRQILNVQGILQRQQDEEERMNARCMGLLESFAVERMTGLRIVDFLHRTARDFVASDEIQAVLLSWQKGTFDARLMLFKAHVYLLQSCGKDTPWLSWTSQAQCFTVIIQSALELRESTVIVNEVLKLAAAHLDMLIRGACEDLHGLQCGSVRFLGSQKNNSSTIKRWNFEQTNFLALTIEAGLDIYALQQMEDWQRSDLQHKKKGRPFLDYALDVDRMKAPSIRLVARLLELGANPNEPWGCSTVWTRYLGNTQFCYSDDPVLGKVSKLLKRNVHVSLKTRTIRLISRMGL